MNKRKPARRRTAKKVFVGHVQFEAVGVRVTASSKREARQKILIKVGRMCPLRLLDRNNFYVDEH